MSLIKPAKHKSSRQVDTECASVEEMGVMDTKFGAKPMLKFTFESGEVNEYGGKRRYTRLFHKHNHEKSSLSMAIKAWTGCNLADLAGDVNEVNWNQYVNLPARLTLEPGNIKDGRRFENITAIEGVKAEVVEPDSAPGTETETTELVVTD